MRISDWSSDVCSSDLSRGREHQPRRAAMLGGDRVLHPFACLETIDKRGAIRLADDVDTVVAIGAAVIPFGAIAAGRDESGRASCRERGCQYVCIVGVAAPLQKTKQSDRITHNR